MKEEFIRGFVGMPFDAHAREFWDVLSRVASRFHHLRLTRFGSDGSTQGNELFESIRRQIQASHFFLADVTPSGDHLQPNPNVLTEAGIALGADKPVYLTARASSFEEVQARMPSDWRGRLIDPILPSRKDWDTRIDDFIRQVLSDFGYPPTQSVKRPGTTESERIRWILELVDALYLRCKSLRTDCDGEWIPQAQKPNRAKLPDSYCFRLEHPILVARNDFVELGAYFHKWTYGTSPFFIVTGDGDVPVAEATSFADLTESDVIEAFITKLARSVLPKFTPGVTIPPTLALKMRSWRDKEAVIRQACAARNLRIAACDWSHDGLMCNARFPYAGFPFGLRVGISLDRWSQYGRSPYWVIVDLLEGSDPLLLRKFRLDGRLRAIVQKDSILFPVWDHGRGFQGWLEDRLWRVEGYCLAASRNEPAVAQPTEDIPDDEVPDDGNEANPSDTVAI